MIWRTASWDPAPHAFPCSVRAGLQTHLFKISIGRRPQWEAAGGAGDAVAGSRGHLSAVTAGQGLAVPLLQGEVREDRDSSVHLCWTCLPVTLQELNQNKTPLLIPATQS